MTSNQSVTLRVHLAGSIAYVPEDGKLWALLPNGIVAEPAQWRSKTDTKSLQARPSHFALLVVDRDLINKQKTTADFSTVYEPWNPKNISKDALYPITPARKAICRLLRNGLDFGFTSGNLSMSSDIQFVPDMGVISCAHSRVDQRYRPGGRGFDYTGISSAVYLNRGDLSVGGYFGGKKKKAVNFGYVYPSPEGKLKFDDIVWQRRVANHLIWSVTLPAGVRQVTIKNMDWSTKSQAVYVLEAPAGCDVINVAVINSELEIPILFLEDPDFPDGVVGFPDPDFELFYSISSNQSKHIPWRVPVPKAGSEGLQEKPCTGGMFKGFE